MARLQFEVPDRSECLRWRSMRISSFPGTAYRIVGSTEASRGCKPPLPGICPIVPVYKGVVSNRQPGCGASKTVRRQVAAGAQTHHFGDPEFL